MLDCLRKIERFTTEGRARFMAESMIQDGVLRNLEVIGEAAKRLDEGYRAAHPEVPWRALGGLHDVLIHQYQGVDIERVWAIVERDLPGLKRAIEALLPPLDQLERELAGEDEPGRPG
jgi:uncharacterized protein with HEPN domain